MFNVNGRIIKRVVLNSLCKYKWNYWEVPFFRDKNGQKSEKECAKAGFGR